MNRSDNLKAFKALGISFFSIGIILLLSGVASFMITSHILSGYVQTAATVTEISDSEAVVSYTVDGRDVRGTLNEYNSFWNVGSTLTAYYNPAEPTSVTTGMIGWLLLLIFGIIGGVFAIIGTVFLIFRAVFNHRRQQLIENGIKLFAVVTNLQINFAVRMSRRHPIRLQCSYTAPDGKTHIFISSDVWTPIDESVIGKTVAVYVSRTNMDSFYVDTDSIEGLSSTVYHVM